METNKKLISDSANLLTVNAKAVDEAIKKAIKNALLQHKRAKNPIAVWRGNKIILLQPDEILFEND